MRVVAKHLVPGSGHAPSASAETSSAGRAEGRGPEPPEKPVTLGPQLCSSGLISANWARADLISREGKAHGSGRWQSPGFHVSVKQGKTRLSGRPR